MPAASTTYGNQEDIHVHWYKSQETTPPDDRKSTKIHLPSILVPLVTRIFEQLPSRIYGVLFSGMGMNA